MFSNLYRPRRSSLFSLIAGKYEMEQHDSRENHTKNGTSNKTYIRGLLFCIFSNQYGLRRSSFLSAVAGNYEM
jgi:uncharacterized protein YqhQ